MDYQAHYNRLIDRARFRELSGYVEIHHIVPVCLGGIDDKDNLVALTAEEHFVAHQFLVKIYPGNRSLIYAALMMGNTRSNNKSYGWLKKQLSRIGHSDEHKKKISESHKGKKRVPFSDEWKLNISKGTKGRKLSNETKQRMSIAQTGRIVTDEMRKNMSIAHKGNEPWNKGKPMSDEAKKKLSETQKLRLKNKKLICVEKE